MAPAKKKGRKSAISLVTASTMEEEDDEFFLTDPVVSASEDEEGSDDERKHQKLLEAISALGGKKRKKLAERTEASLQVSEFGISTEGAGEKIELTDLIKPIKKENKLSKVKKQLNKLQTTKAVELPLSKEETEKIQRIVSYKNISEEVSKWDNVVKENRRAEQIIFPLNDQSLKPAPIEDTVSGWKTSTPLETEIFSILNKNKQPITDPLLTPVEEASLKAMSLEEAKQRRAELQKARVLQSYYEAKARREKKIKSKKYHKLLKKAQKKEILKKFEDLRKTNPDAALEELEKLEKARIQERMSLKHQNSGKWAKSKAIMAKYDEGARRAMQEQLQKNKELTMKVQVVSEDEEEEKEIEIVPDFVNDAEMTLEGANPWMIGKLRSDAKEAETQEETQKEEVVKIEESEEEDDELSEDETLLQEFEDRRRLRKELGEQEPLAPKSKSGALAGGATEDNAGEVSRFNRLFKQMLEQNKKETTEKKSGVAPEEEEPVTAEKEQQLEEERTKEDEEEGPLLIESLERNRTLEDLETMGEQEMVRDQKKPHPEKPTDISKPTGKNQTKKSTVINITDVLPTKARLVQTPLLPTTVEEEEEVEDSEISQKMMIREAFSGDDVVRDFLKEKRAAVNAAKPQEINLVLPGWGEWGGTNLKVSARKRRRFIIKAPPAPPRKDAWLPKVIINEKRNVGAAGHQVNELPFPFNNRNSFESTIRSPVGNTWNTQKSVQKLTAPRVITKKGHIIEPITEDVFQKHNAPKKAAIELGNPKTNPNTKPNRQPPKGPKNKRKKIRSKK